MDVFDEVVISIVGFACHLFALLFNQLGNVVVLWLIVRAVPNWARVSLVFGSLWSLLFYVKVVTNWSCHGLQWLISN